MCCVAVAVHVSVSNAITRRTQEWKASVISRRKTYVNNVDLVNHLLIPCTDKDKDENHVTFIIILKNLISMKIMSRTVLHCIHLLARLLILCAVFTVVARDGATRPAINYTL